MELPPPKADLPVPFIGGPKDGTWEKVDPRDELTPDLEYRRKFLKWGWVTVRYYAVFIHRSVTDDDILQLLLMGYGNNAGHIFKVVGTTTKPKGKIRSFDLG